MASNNKPYYTYSFYGSSVINNNQADFELKLMGMGKLDQFQDYAAFKAVNLPLTLKPLELEEDVTLGEEVYNAGQVPLVIDIESFNPLFHKEAIFDNLRYGFVGILSGIITDLPINKFGLKKLYRIKIATEYGFSGGPVFNKEGKVIGITILRINNFSYAISADDLKVFIKNLKYKKP